MDESDLRGQRYHGLEKLILAGSVLAAAAWVLRRRPFVVAVEGPSMAPTLRPGDFLIAVQSGPVRDGSLVVVEDRSRPGYEMVKRVVGLPGDRVGERALGDDEYWVLGDNLMASTDSRALGPVPRSSIKGVIRARYWPASRLRLLG